MPPKKTAAPKKETSKDKKSVSRDKKPAAPKKSVSRDKKPVAPKKDASRDKKSVSRDKKPVTSSRDKKPATTRKTPVDRKSKPSSNRDDSKGSKGSLDKKKSVVVARRNPSVKMVPSEIAKGLNLKPKFGHIPDMHLVQEEVADDYIRSTKLDSFLILALRESIHGNSLPINPYPKILRCLRTSLWHQICSKNYEDRSKSCIKNLLDVTPRSYQISSIRQEGLAYGYNLILEKISISNLRFVTKYMRDYLTSNSFSMADCDVKIHPSLSGSFFFENELINNPSAFSNYIEVHLHHMIETDLLRKAVDLYLKLVYDDIKENSSR